jgi:putative transposase
MHVTQRGVNRAATFYDDADRRHYLAGLARAARRFDVAVHAYALMTNHVHLLVSASCAGAVSKALRQSSGCYVQTFNHRHARTGTLWEGRFRSSAVDSDAYVLAVYRYIELNPVRAGITDRPETYRWTSARANLGLTADPLITPHPTFLALSEDRQRRIDRYRELLEAGLAQPMLSEIRHHISTQRVLAPIERKAILAEQLHRTVDARPRGRPPRGGRTPQPPSSRPRT